MAIVIYALICFCGGINRVLYFKGNFNELPMTVFGFIFIDARFYENRSETEVAGR